MKPSVTGIVLAGGQSQRMGSDKGLLIFNNKKLIEYPVDLLRQICDKILISANTSAYNYLGFPVIADQYRSIGPISGLHSGLLATETEQNIFLANDMPFVDLGIMDILMEKRSHYEIIVPSVDARPFPVCGYYNKSILPIVEKEINNCNYSLHGLLKKCNSLVIEVENDSSRIKLKNINTMKEFLQLTSDFIK